MTAPPERRDPAREPGSESDAAGSSDVTHPIAPIVDLQEAADFLTAIDPDREEWHFRTFPDKGNGRGRKIDSTLEGAAIDLQLANGNTHGVFVVINEGGHKKADITRVAAVFADFDGTPLPSNLPLPPHAIVESSPGKYHVYWRVEDVPVAAFTAQQKAIAEALRSDPSVTDASRVMRLPGFLHHKGAPFRSTVIHTDPRPPYTAAEIVAAFPPALTTKAAATNPLAAPQGAASAAVEVARHEDALALTARLARLVWLGGMDVESGWAAIQAEAARGRWTREMPELRRCYDDALAKLTSGEWKSGAVAGVHPDEPRKQLFTPIGELLLRDTRPDWLVRRLLERDTLAGVFGLSNVGKSFVTVDLACSIASGTEFFGHQVKQGPVLYIAGEGHRGITKRVKAWAAVRGVDLSTAPLHISEAAIPLRDKDALASLQTEIDEITAAHGSPALIVVDTLNRNFGGGNENSTEDMTGFVAGKDALRQQTGACVLVVHHTSKANPDSARGSNVLLGALDWEYCVQADAGVQRLVCTKAKDHEKPADMCFRITGGIDIGDVDEDGEPAPSAVLTQAIVLARATAGKAGRGKHQTAALRVLTEILDECRAALTAAGRDPDQAWVPRNEWRARCVDSKPSIPGRRFDEAFKSLDAGGLIVVKEGRVTLGDGHRYEPYES